MGSGPTALHRSGNPVGLAADVQMHAVVWDVCEVAEDLVVLQLVAKKCE